MNHKQRKKKMDFNTYQEQAKSTAIYHKGIPFQKSDMGLIYTALGLAGEAGEVAEHSKKFIRDGIGTLEDFAVRREAVKKELGDVLWYLAMHAHEWRLSLDEIAQANIEKLQSRKERGVLHGSGSDR